MDNDIKLQDDSVEITGGKVTLNADGAVELIGNKVRADAGSGGMVQLSGSKFITSVTNIEMGFHGGHLSAVDGIVELGSIVSGKFKGFIQRKDRTLELTGDQVEIAGDKLKTSAGTTEIGNTSNGKFRGIMLSDSGVRCYANSVMVLNPDVHPNDGKVRIALAQSSDDELLINAKGNYNGGVKLDGPVHFSGDVSMQTTLQMKVGSKLLLLTPDHVKKLPGGKKIHIPGQAIDVLETIQNLQATVKQLQDRVAVLEAHK